MATIIAQPLSKSKTKLHTVKIDMTPMVDLGFLLITFFIFTTSLAEPTVTKLNMPKEDSSIVMEVAEKTLLTALLDKGEVLVYEGSFEKALAQNRLRSTTYDVQSGFGKLIRQKQKNLETEKLKDELMVVIKPLPTASYQEVLNALDEMEINRVRRYGIIPTSGQEKAWLVTKQH
jgi:biopolymer transport protein ExbD